MIGILILTHGKLADGYVSALEMISGHAKNLDTLELYHETSIDTFKEEVATKMQQLDQGEGVLVFCDIFGASPYNVTAQNYHLFKHTLHYRSITGVNLPMVIEAACSRDAMGLDELAAHVQAIGKAGIKELFDVYGKEEKQ